MKRGVTVLGAGFSGLTTAYYLSRAGHPVEVLERGDRPGGLISTHRTEHGLVESAALGIRNSARFEQLCQDLGLEIVETRRQSRARYIYRSRPCQWPLTASETLQAFARLAAASCRGRLRPVPGESVAQWSRRTGGTAVSEWLVAPALQGIYAGDVCRMSASLVFERKTRPMAARRKGLVSTTGGMGQVAEALADALRRRGVMIQTGQAGIPENGRTVIATSAKDAAAVLARRAPGVSELLTRIELLPLVRITAFYPASENRIAGFGVRFPRGVGVRSLGVLFDSNIFAGRGEWHAESWILGGAHDREIVDLADRDLMLAVDRDRQQLTGHDMAPLARYVHRWREALPHYTTDLERCLAAGITLPKDISLTGNYLGKIGLSMLLERSADIAKSMQIH
jgi:oxygen-dependent protoporphyrinogen oxidase